jgi:histidine triad (HIT) family protein
MEGPRRECPFCRIADGLEQAELVCERASWLAFFPPQPATPGHTLIIPRAHVADLWSADPELAHALVDAAIEVGRAVDRAVSPEGMNLISSAGEAAEQTVFHLHLHIVPRWRADELDIWPPKTPMQTKLKEDLAAAIRAACRGPETAT